MDGLGEAGLKILVCGGRAFDDYDRLQVVLDQHNLPENEIIHGDAPGADRLAGKWAVRRGVTCRSYPANWNLHGNAAGPIRNQKMLDVEHPDLVIAFPGGRGTDDMVMRAKRARIPVVFG